MDWVGGTALCAYFVVLAFLSLFGLHRLIMVFLYYRHRKNSRPAATAFAELPRVTVQLPTFTEMYVVERLIDAVCALDYPRDRFEVQVLDDSTDETTGIAAHKVEAWRERGVDIHYIHRDNREGYKAGALAHGLTTARGEFVAVFDADFLPNPDLLLRCVHHFSDPGVGMVQARWEHLNRDYSLLTRVQSILLDGHFVMEHGARFRSGRFFNFNGTAGVWRRTAIETSGGWQHDTLTEDLDLSYRAQLKGWRFVYVQEVESPSEVPVEMSAFKSQQFRWAKGSIQTGLKLLPAIWRSAIPLTTKIEATFHLTNNFAYLLMLCLSLLMVPAIAARGQGMFRDLYLVDALVFVLATLSVLIFYVAAQREIAQNWGARLRCFPMVMCIGIGLSVSNSRAVIEALLGKQTSFERTPKYAVAGRADSWKTKKYAGKRDLIAYVELALGLYYLGAFFLAMAYKMWASLPFLLLFPTGFLYVSLLSFFQVRTRDAQANA
ncbi:MAG: glycosyltransferase [Planctomycetes bacterium]|nr:glycosyltransferase [Planctomycetota bacterium]